MSHIYDNWERLVAAVLKKQQLWELFHAHSRNSSISSSVSTDFSSTFSGRISFIRRSKEPILEINFNEILEAENLDGPASIFQDERIDRYESDVYMTLSDLRDGTVDVKRVQFSGIRYDAVQAKTWWLENQRKVYDTYNVRGIRRSKEPILEINFNEILEAENLDEPASIFQDEWIDRYESGVYMTLSALRDGTVDVKRVQFSGIRFDAVQAKIWWLENQKKVYETYNVRHGRRRFNKQEAEARWSGKKWKFYKFFNEITRVRQLSSKATSNKKELFSKGSEENKALNKPSKLILEHGGKKEPILEINFNEILESANLEGTSGKFQDEWSDGYELGKCKRWIERYESGVYITLSALKDGTVDVERVRFSRIRFDAEQVKTWWLENQKHVCERQTFTTSQPRLS